MDPNRALCRFSVGGAPARLGYIRHGKLYDL